MNISEVSQQLSSLLSKASSMFLAATDDFASNLSVGQVIKGKVLRSYDAGRYLVDFNGHEKVVDSSVPLKTGELIQGKVVGIGEKVELKRLPLAADAKSDGVVPDLPVRGFLGNKWEAMVRDAMVNYQIKLSSQDKSLFLGMLKNSRMPEQALLAAVALLKQGLPMSEQLIQLLSELQIKGSNLKLYPVSQYAPVLSVVDANTAEHAADALSNFVSSIANLLQEQQGVVNAEKTALDGNDATGLSDSGQDAQDSRQDQDFALNWHLLNSQVDGSVSHRVSTLPMWFGDKLIEINVAIFEQTNRGFLVPESIKHKRLVFSLDLEHLGKVEVESIIENKNIRLRVSADNQAATECLVEYASYLKNDLVAYGWRLDEISYSTKGATDMSGVVNSVIQHYVSQDSLNRVM